MLFLRLLGALLLSATVVATWSVSELRGSPAVLVTLAIMGVLFWLVFPVAGWLHWNFSNKLAAKRVSFERALELLKLKVAVLAIDESGGFTKIWLVESGDDLSGSNAAVLIMMERATPVKASRRQMQHLSTRGDVSHRIVHVDSWPYLAGRLPPEL